MLRREGKEESDGDVGPRIKSHCIYATDKVGLLHRSIVLRSDQVSESSGQFDPAQVSDPGLDLVGNALIRSCGEPEKKGLSLQRKTARCAGGRLRVRPGAGRGGGSSDGDAADERVPAVVDGERAKRGR